MDDSSDLDKRTVKVARKLNEEISVDEPITWDDVSDDLSSGDWGHAIQEGIVETTEDGDEYIINDVPYDEQDDGDILLDIEDREYDEPKWSKYDKFALIGVFFLVIGYWSNTTRDIIGGFVDIFIGPINSILPFFAVLLLFAVLTSVYSTVLQSKLIDKAKLSNIKARLKMLQDKQNEDLEDMPEDEKQETQMAVMSTMMDLFKTQFQPAVWVAFLTIPFFLWVWWIVQTGQIPQDSTTIIFPLVGEIGWNDSVIGPLRAWIFWYIVCSISFSQLISKVFNLDFNMNITN